MAELIQQVPQSLERLADLRTAVYCLLSRCVCLCVCDRRAVLTEQKPISVTTLQHTLRRCL